MGIGGISVWQLLILLLIVMLLFGTKRLRNIGSDLGGALRGFRKSMSDDDDKDKDEPQLKADPPREESKDDEKSEAKSSS